MVHDHGMENVLVMQGVGSLGAFGCGVFKAFADRNVKVDIIAGTSIGGVNTAIIAGSKNEHSEVALEQFWLELAENSVDLALPWQPAACNRSGSYYSQYYQQASTSLKNALAFYSSAAYGNSTMFAPRWMPKYAMKDPQYFRPDRWTYIYDHSLLASTLEKYVGYSKLKPGGNPNARLIITAVNDKRVFIVENYPKKIERLPQNLPEVLHRARDIMFSDKTAHNIKMSKAITRYLQFIEELYEIVESNLQVCKIDKQTLDHMHRKYQKMLEHGTEIRKITYITREERFPYLYENTNFSPEGIKNLIKEGESKTKQMLDRMTL